MPTLANTVVRYLQIFDKTHPIFKALLADPDGVPEITIQNPNDFNIGAIAGVLEWNRQLTLTLKDQLRLDLATGKFLDLIVTGHIGITKYVGETELEFITRVQQLIMDPKLSPASIIYHTIPFSSPALPYVVEGVQDAAFSDVTFSDQYRSFKNATIGSPEFNFWILPAITVGAAGSVYFFTLVLENTDPADIAKVVDWVDNLIAAGIGYEIEINYP